MRGDQTQDLVLREDRGRVAILTLNRPSRLNAWNRELEKRYFERLAEIDGEPETRAVVVTGAGDAFCAGADIEDLASVVTGDRPIRVRTRAFYFPATIGTPIVAAINGPAVAIGLVQALYCDVRFASVDAKLIPVFARRGLVAEYGASWILARTVGRGRALDLLLSGRTVLGHEAKAIGLVEEVAPPGEVLQRAVEYANDLAELSSPFSVATIKAQIAADLEGTFQGSFEASEALMKQSFRRPDPREGVASFIERRPPRFDPYQRSSEEATDSATV